MKLFLKILSVVIVIVVAALTILFANRGEKAVLSDNEAQQSVSPSPSVEISPSASPSPYDGAVNPLTGMPLKPDAVDNRPYAIMLDNIKVAQPLLGISKADILFEIPVEGGITRLMALFQDMSDVGLIGSVRSSRPYFVEIARGYDAVYIHAGGSSQAYNIIKSTGIDHLDGVNGSKDDIFFRDPARKKAMGYEHSLETSGELIGKFLPTYGINLKHEGFNPGMVFAGDATPNDGTPAASVTVQFASSRSTGFEYDAQTGLYKVSQFAKAYLDGNTGEQLGVKNVLVLRTGVFNIAGDTAGRLDVEVTGSGDGTFICGGKNVPVQWSKKNAASPFVFTYKNGTPLVFGKGVTYICVVSDTSKVDIH